MGRFFMTAWNSQFIWHRPSCSSLVPTLSSMPPCNCYGLKKSKRHTIIVLDINQKQCLLVKRTIFLEIFWKYPVYFCDILKLADDVVNRLGVIGLGLVFGRVTFDLCHLALQLKGIARGSEVVLRYSHFWSLSAEKLKIHLPEPTKRSIFALSRPWGPVTSRTASQHSLVTANPKKQQPQKPRWSGAYKIYIVCLWTVPKKIQTHTQYRYFLLQYSDKTTMVQVWTAEKNYITLPEILDFFLLFFKKEWNLFCRFPEKNDREGIFSAHAPSNKTKECKEINNIHWKLYDTNTSLTYLKNSSYKRCF